MRIEQPSCFNRKRQKGRGEGYCIGFIKKKCYLAMSFLYIFKKEVPGARERQFPGQSGHEALCLPAWMTHISPSRQVCLRGQDSAVSPGPHRGQGVEEQAKRALGLSIAQASLIQELNRKDL